MSLSRETLIRNGLIAFVVVAIIAVLGHRLAPRTVEIPPRITANDLALFEQFDVYDELTQYIQDSHVINLPHGLGIMPTRAILALEGPSLDLVPFGTLIARGPSIHPTIIDALKNDSIADDDLRFDALFVLAQHKSEARNDYFRELLVDGIADPDSLAYWRGQFIVMALGEEATTEDLDLLSDLLEQDVLINTARSLRIQLNRTRRIEKLPELSEQVTLAEELSSSSDAKLAFAIRLVMELDAQIALASGSSLSIQQAKIDDSYTVLIGSYTDDTVDTKWMLRIGNPIDGRIPALFITEGGGGFGSNTVTAVIFDAYEGRYLVTLFEPFEMILHPLWVDPLEF